MKKVKIIVGLVLVVVISTIFTISYFIFLRVSVPIDTRFNTSDYHETLVYNASKNQTEGFRLPLPKGTSYYKQASDVSSLYYSRCSYAEFIDYYQEEGLIRDDGYVEYEGHVFKIDLKRSGIKNYIRVEIKMI